MKAVMLGCLLLATPAWAQEGPARMMLEAGIDSGNSVACPGHYVGIQGRVAGPVSGYGSADNYRCLDVAGKTTRAGISVRLGRAVAGPACGARGIGIRRSRSVPHHRRQPDARPALWRTPDR